MNLGKIFLGIVILLLALLLQLWIPVAGIRGDFILATLIAFAFIYSFWELVFFVILSFFAINWQPMPSFELVVFSLMPFAAHALRVWLTWERWIGIAISVIAGIFVFYAIVTPAAAVRNWESLLVDALICTAFAEIVAWGAE